MVPLLPVVERGIIKVGEEVENVGIKETQKSSPCTGALVFRKLLDEGRAGGERRCSAAWYQT